jgi:hypothetical protein
VSDPLGVLFSRPAVVERYLGDGAHGTTLDSPEPVRGRIRFKRKLVRNASGDQVMSEAGIALSVDVSTIPVDSEVTIDGTTRKVIAEERHIIDVEGAPNYYSVDLE